MFVLTLHLRARRFFRLRLGGSFCFEFGFRFRTLAGDDRADLARVEVRKTLEQQADAGAVDRAGQALLVAVGEVLHGGADARGHAGVQFGQFVEVLEQGTAAGQHDAADELLPVKARPADFPHHVVQDLLGARLDDQGEVLLADLLGLTAPQTGNDDQAVLEHLAGEGGTVVNLEFFGVVLHDGTAGLYVFGEDVTTEGNHGRVADDAVLENGNVRRSTANVNEGDARLLLVFVQHGSGAGDGFQRYAGHFQTGPLHAAVDVVAGRDLAGDDVEVRLQPGAGHTDRVGNSLLIVDGVLLRDHVQDLIAGGQDKLVHVADQPVDVPLGDLVLGVIAHQHAAVLQALDVLAGNTDVDNVKRLATRLLGQFAGLADGADGFLNVGNDAPHDALGFHLAGAEDFQTPVSVALPHEGADFGGADVKSGYDVVSSGISHNNILY